jgi:hypothetical protein
VADELWLDEESQRIIDVADREGHEAARCALDTFLDRVKRLDADELAKALDFNARLVTELVARRPLMFATKRA